MSVTAEKSIFDRTMFDMAPIGMLLYTADGRIERANPAVCKLLGLTEAEIQAQGDDLTCLDDRSVDKRIRTRLQDSKLDLVSERKRFLRHNGDLVHTRLKVLAERDDAGELVRYLVQIVDITERHNLRHELDRIGRIDLLTRLPNRRAMLVELRKAVAQSGPQGQMAFLFLNIDRFQIVNDALGPRLADEFLLVTANRLRGHVPLSGTLGRVGGDEFGVILPSTDPRSAVRLATRLIEEMHQPFTVGDRTFAASASVGIACLPKDGQSAEDLLKHADLAMHQAKLAKSGYQLYSSRLENYAQDWLVTETNLVESIRRESFELEFQPVRARKDNSVAFSEALVRWRDGDSLIKPDAFIPVAEATGLIRDIDGLVMRKAIGALADNQVEGGNVSVNLSPISLRDHELLDLIRTMLTYHKIKGEQLIVEMTETSLIVDYPHTKANIDALRSIGVRFAIDDFGAGFTSLALLRTLEVDLLKIDRTFIAGIGERRIDETIIAAMIDLGRDMGIVTVAEGVETVAQRDWLTERGCDYYQGYINRLFNAVEDTVSKPAVPEELLSKEMYTGKDVLVRPPLNS